MPTRTAMVAPSPTPIQDLTWCWSDGPRRIGDARIEEEDLWMSKEEMAPAWAVSLLTLAALATLVGLALMG